MNNVFPWWATIVGERSLEMVVDVWIQDVVVGLRMDVEIVSEE